jgi:hypothetical protein
MGLIPLRRAAKANCLVVLLLPALATVAVAVLLFA